MNGYRRARRAEDTETNRDGQTKTKTTTHKGYIDNFITVINSERNIISRTRRKNGAIFPGV
jgi:hypothetical protein